MPYTIKGKCIYKKDTGKKVGCTKGSVKKYMAALHSNVKEDIMKKFYEISQILNESSNPPDKIHFWDAYCPKHGHFGGSGPITKCPECMGIKHPPVSVKDLK